MALLQLRPSQAAASWVFSLFTPGLRSLCACAPSPLAAGSRLFLPQGRNTQQAGFSGKPGHSPSYVLHLLTGRLGEKNFGPSSLDQQTKYASPGVFQTWAWRCLIKWCDEIDKQFRVAIMKDLFIILPTTLNHTIEIHHSVLPFIAGSVETFD